MKKTLVSMAAASLLITSAVAADKGIDIVTSGEAVVYYETNSDNGTGNNDLFNANAGLANHLGSEFQFGIRLNLDADLGNNFTFGSELQYKGTAGLDDVLGDTRQQATTNNTTDSLTDSLMLSQMFVSKKIGNTTAKAGRQQLPRSLFPFTYTEGWNVMKNSFEAFVVVNKDLPKTSVVGAIIGKSNPIAPNDTAKFGTMAWRTANEGAAPLSVAHRIFGPTYAMTLQNKSLPNTTLTGSYYRNNKVGVTEATSSSVDTFWAEAAVAGKDLPMGLTVGLQGGVISPDAAGMKDTNAFGAKIAVKPTKETMLQVAYTTVDDGSFAVLNTATTIKSPLFTQMIFNQHNIGLDNDTVVVKGSYSLGSLGTIIAQYGMSDAGAGSVEASDYDEFDLMYKVKVGGVQYFASWMNRQWDAPKSATRQGLLASSGSDKDDRIRFWARYAF